MVHRSFFVGRFRGSGINSNRILQMFNEVGAYMNLVLDSGWAVTDVCVCFEKVT